ncbi:SDR family NAD(P)-dependent oxidoreductase [Leucothrix arctica]|uniref:Short-chain dehydrogenase n=1 Tax=Leucothrix arctica TaxID=1481894 RepID=A0A317CJW0_9GAMM|nr:SDR family NAD(P)-dependent oxidoreductase [Leucothrix arctica]PWQ98497.1 short-chain dehydrogenase [Leucothrix arctica]
MKNVLITGCSTGIGYCTALGLKVKGYRVIATARTENDIAKLEAEGLEVINLEVSDSDSIHQAVKKVHELCNGELYAVFHNAAYGQPGAIEDLSRKVLETQFATNFFGWVELNNLLIPLLRKQDKARIIFNSSVLGIISLPYRGSYNASKYALEGMADTLRLELHSSNIDVCLIEPGPVESDFRKNSLKAFKANIDIENSHHSKKYLRQIKRMETIGPAAPFTLPAEAVLKKVIHALESNKPKARYYVTFPTYLFGYLKRILPTRWLDKVLLYVSKSEMK